MSDRENPVKPGRSKWYNNSVVPVLPALIESARWYSGKGKSIENVQLLDYGILDATGKVIIALVQISYAQDGTEIYLLPQRITEDNSMPVEDAVSSKEFISSALDIIFRGSVVSLENGRIFGVLEADDRPAPEGNLSVRTVSAEQSNTSVIIDDKLVYKSFRKLSSGDNPDYSVSSYLRRKCDFPWVPETLGRIVVESKGWRYDAGTLTAYIRDAADGFNLSVKIIKSAMADFSAGNTEDAHVVEGMIIARMARLGNTTGVMHNCFSRNSQRMDFQPEPIRNEDILTWMAGYKSLLGEAWRSLESLEGSGLDRLRSTAETVLKGMGNNDIFTKYMTKLPDNAIYKTRIHGDFHLGQTLVSGEDFYIIDFEGEPMRPMEYRIGKFMPLKDVGGMVRSIEYAVDMASQQFKDMTTILNYAGSLKKDLKDSFLSAYYDAYDPVNIYLPEDKELRDGVLGFFTAEKALYEVIYEIRNRPNYASIPLTALKGLVSGAA